LLNYSTGEILQEFYEGDICKKISKEEIEWAMDYLKKNSDLLHTYNKIAKHVVDADFWKAATILQYVIGNEEQSHETFS
jgi:hypothetical protein